MIPSVASRIRVDKVMFICDLALLTRSAGTSSAIRRRRPAWLSRTHKITSKATIGVIDQKPSAAMRSVPTVPGTHRRGEEFRAMAAIELRNVTKKFATADGGTYTALKDLYLTVEEGQFCAVVGPTGCGKSTT